MRGFERGKYWQKLIIRAKAADANPGKTNSLFLLTYLTGQPDII